MKAARARFPFCGPFSPAPSKQTNVVLVVDEAVVVVVVRVVIVVEDNVTVVAVLDVDSVLVVVDVVVTVTVAVAVVNVVVQVPSELHSVQSFKSPEPEPDSNEKSLYSPVLTVATLQQRPLQTAEAQS